MGFQLSGALMLALMVPHIPRNQLKTRGKPPFFREIASWVRALSVCSGGMDRS
jgi:hypothetical protein